MLAGLNRRQKSNEISSRGEGRSVVVSQSGVLEIDGRLAEVSITCFPFLFGPHFFLDPNYLLQVDDVVQRGATLSGDHARWLASLPHAGYEFGNAWLITWPLSTHEVG